MLKILHLLKYVILLFIPTFVDGWNNRILNGDVAVEGAFPFAVALHYGLPRSIVFVCGGSIISPICILTAAHCIAPERQLDGDYSYYAVVGTNYLNQLENTQIEKVDQILIHPEFQYLNGPMPNDICILKLENRLWFNEFVRPIFVAPPETVYWNGTAVIPGWGLTSSNVVPHIPTNDLRYMIVPLISNEECKSLLQNYMDNVSLITDHHFCTGVPPGDGPPLQGCPYDSGMPLIIFDYEYGGENLIGMPTWTPFPCGLPPLPTVYINPTYYTDFIYRNCAEKDVM